MELKRITNEKKPYTALLYCKPGGGKSTAIGLIAERSEGNTLVLDIDRTIMRTLAKGEVVKDTSKVMVCQVDNINTFETWTQAIMIIITYRSWSVASCQTWAQRAKTREFRRRLIISICSSSWLIPCDI